MAVHRIAGVLVCLLGLSGVVHGHDLPPDEEDLLDGIASTQGSYGLHEKGIERLNEARNVAPLSVDTVFGDQVSRFDGTTEFQVTDISIPATTSSRSSFGARSRSTTARRSMATTSAALRSGISTCRA